MSHPSAFPAARGLSSVIGGTQPAKRRWFIVAAALSLLLPGLGQLYNTRLSRGLVFIALAAAGDLAIFGALLLPPTPMATLSGFTAFGAVIAFRLFTAVEAGLDARRRGVAPLTRANRWFVYPAILLAYGVQSELVGWALAEVWGASRWKTYHIPSEAMAPTVMRGDRLVSWRHYYSDHDPKRGDLAVFKLPRDNRTDYIKRIVGLPGDRVQIKDGVLHINDTAVRRELVRGSAGPARYWETLPNGRGYETVEYSDRGDYDNTPVFEVPPGHYFVLGDNRDNSLDSRVPAERFGVGLVPRSNLRDRPTVVYWSADLRRIGTTLR